MIFVNLEEETESETEFIAETENSEPDLFSYEGNIPEKTEPETEAFSFRVEEKFEEKPQENFEEKITGKTSFSEDKPIEFSFFIGGQSEEPKMETPKFNSEFEAKTEIVNITETKIETEEIKTFENSVKLDVQDDFTFIDKTVSSEKIMERRNKLKEFNSRYQIDDTENEFEMIPAFKRKNI
jgi:cell division protein FtsZ